MRMINSDASYLLVMTYESFESRCKEDSCPSFHVEGCKKTEDLWRFQISANLGVLGRMLRSERSEPHEEIIQGDNGRLELTFGQEQETAVT